MTDGAAASALTRILGAHMDAVLAEWLRILEARGGTGGGLVKASELKAQCSDVLAALRQAVAAAGSMDMQEPAFERVRDLLGEVSRSRAAHGFNPSETATFVFSLKQPLFERIRRDRKVRIFRKHCRAVFAALDD